MFKDLTFTPLSGMPASWCRLGIPATVEIEAAEGSQIQGHPGQLGEIQSQN